MTSERTSIRGVVETVFYSGPAFSAGRLRTADGEFVKFAGKVFVKISEPVKLDGHWVNHPKYGRQFEAEFMGHDLELDPDGLAHFLANHPDVKGIGPVKTLADSSAIDGPSPGRFPSRPDGWRGSAPAHPGPVPGHGP